MSTLAKIENALRAACAPTHANVWLEAAGSNRVGGHVISTRFDGLKPSERQDLIWAYLDAALTQSEAARISFIIADVPAECAGLAKVDDENSERNRFPLDTIRKRGWDVAVHNDYRQNGSSYTFWLFTKGDLCAKGEGRTDHEALTRVVYEIDRIENEMRNGNV